MNELHGYWSSKIDEQFRNGLGLHTIYFVQLSRLDFQLSENETSYLSQQARATIKAANIYLGQIALIEAELEKLAELGRHLNTPHPTSHREWWDRLEDNLNAIEQRIDTLWDNRRYTVIDSEPPNPQEPPSPPTPVPVSDQ